MDQLTLGVIARSRKESERRLAIHPLHIKRIAADLRERIYLERGYGERFGVPDEQLRPYVAGLRARAELFAECDVLLLPKPQLPDVEQMRDRQVLWGWPHCVHDQAVTQLSVERRLTLIAFEAMNYWSADGSFSLHVFHKNNEMAGYSASAAPLVLQPQPEILAPGVTCGRPLHRPAAVEVTDNGRYLATDAEHTRGGRWPRHFLVRSRRTGLGRLGWHLRR